MDARNYSVYDELLDGRRVLLRAIRPEDKKVLLEGFGRLSDESVHRRFFSMKKGLSERDLAYFTELDFTRHVALLAFVDESEGQLGVGVGRFVVEDHHPTPGTAEIAFTVDDAHQGLGIGTALLKHLVAIARDLGLRPFFSMKKGLSERDLAYFTELDFIRHVALLAFVDESESQLGVGVGRFAVEDHHPTPGTAEIAFTVDDAHQGLGVGTTLLKHLVAIARDLGLREFRAEVLAENRAMLHVFSHSGLPMRQTRSSGVAEVYLSLGKRSRFGIAAPILVGPPRGLRELCSDPRCQR